MTGRLHVQRLPLARLLPALTSAAPLIESPNMAPRQPVSAIRMAQGRMTLSPLFWGLTPPWLKVLDHAPHCARAETLSKRAMFQEAFNARRCVIPVSGFYVWKPQARNKQPYLVTHVQRTPAAGCPLVPLPHHLDDLYRLDGLDQRARQCLPVIADRSTASGDRPRRRHDMAGPQHRPRPTDTAIDAGPFGTVGRFSGIKACEQPCLSVTLLRASRWAHAALDRATGAVMLRLIPAYPPRLAARHIVLGLSTGLLWGLCPPPGPKRAPLPTWQPHRQSLRRA